MAIAVGMFYAVVGVTFALPANSAVGPIRVAWRLAAWAVSGIAFVSHLAYESRDSSAGAALRAAVAVAIGGFLLAAWINVRKPPMQSEQRETRARLALVVFPVVTGVPAFLAGWAGTAIVKRIRR